MRLDLLQVQGREELVLNLLLESIYQIHVHDGVREAQNKLLVMV